MSSDLLKRLYEQRMRAVAQMREISERAAKGEALRAEDEETYTRASKDVDRLGGLMADERKNSEADAEHAAAQEAASRKAGMREDAGDPGNEERAKTWREEAREAIKIGKRDKGGTYEQLPNPREFLPTTRNRLAQRIEKRTTLAVGTSGSGPELVPVTLVDRLFEKLFDDVALLQAGVTILRTESGETIKFPRLTALGALSQANARRTEGATIQFGEPTFDQVQLDAYKYAQGSKASREVIEDAIIDIEGLMGTVIGRNMANYLGQDLLSGTGSSLPRGVLQIIADTTANIVTGATGQSGGLGGTVGTSTDEFSKLMDVVWKLKPGYRRNARFMVNDSTVLAIRKVKINSEANNFAWMPGSANTPDTLLGYPLLTDPFMPEIGLGNLSIAFCDFSLYQVRLVNDTRVEWSTEYAWDTDEVAVKAILRADGDALDDTAFAGFKGGAS